MGLDCLILVSAENKINIVDLENLQIIKQGKLDEKITLARANGKSIFAVTDKMQLIIIDPDSTQYFSLCVENEVKDF